MQFTYSNSSYEPVTNVGPKVLVGPASQGILIKGYGGNAIVSTGMPQKFNPSTGDSIFSRARKIYIKDAGALTKVDFYKHNDASEQIRLKKMNAIGKSTKAYKNKISFQGKSNDTTVINSSLARVRGGGTVAPKKKGAINNPSRRGQQTETVIEEEEEEDIGTFQYTQPTTEYNENDSPFVNTDESFTTLTKTTSESGSDTIVSWAYVFDDKGTLVDGLYLNGTITTPENMSIDDFGSIPMSRQGSQFKNYTGSFPLTSTNIPTLLPNTTCFEMFYGASNFNQDIGSWDTSTVTDMSYMFQDCTNFNQNIGSWDTSNVTTMRSMFYDAYTFNKNISSKIANNGSDYLAWDTSNVTDMSYMFHRTGTRTPLQSFNNSEANTFGIAGTKPLNWNTTNVVNMYRMFNYCAYFNQYIGTKYITITNGSTTYNYISWDVKHVTSMNRVLDSAFNFNNGEIENSYTTPLRWNTVSVTTFERAFRKWRVYNSYNNRYNQNMYSETITLEDSVTTYTSWNTSNATTMYRMFENTNFNNGASSGSGDNPMNWDMTANTNCQYMFDNCSNFNSPVNFTNTNNVTTFGYMFKDCSVFNQPIIFNTSSAITYGGMFARCSLFNQNIGSLNMTNLASIGFQLIDRDYATQMGFVMEELPLHERYESCSPGDGNEEVRVAVITPAGYSFLVDTSISTDNFDLSLEGWASQSTPTIGIAVSSNADYSLTGEIYRDILINEYGWSFSGGELVQVVN